MIHCIPFYSSNSFDRLNDSDAEVSPPQPNCKQMSTKTTRHLKRKPKPRKLTCLVINCRSLKNEVEDIAAVIDEHKPDVILGNESWLILEIASSEIFPEGYTVFRKDRVDGQNGGGVFQAIKGDIISTHRVDLDTDCEIIWSQCQMAGRRSKSLFLASFYRPHVYDVKSLAELDASLLRLGDKLHKHDVIVAGDFNAPNISGDNLEASANLSSSSSSKKLIELTQEYNLMQLVKEPTRRQGNSSSTLDLVLSNRPDIICNVSVEPGISDHDLVLFTLKLSCHKKRHVKRKVYIRKGSDDERTKLELKTLSAKLNTQYNKNSVEAEWNDFENSVRNILDSCIPHKMTSSRYNLLWFNRSLRRKSRAKQRLYNKAKKTGSVHHWNKFFCRQKTHA